MKRLPFAATPLSSVRSDCQPAEIRPQNCPAPSALGSPSPMVFGLLFKAGNAPWQKLLPPFLGEKTAPDEHCCQIALRVKLVCYGREYEGVVEARSIGSFYRSAKKVIFSADYDRLNALSLRDKYEISYLSRNTNFLEIRKVARNILMLNNLFKTLFKHVQIFNILFVSRLIL